MRDCLKNIVLIPLLFLLWKPAITQCIKDSNYYSINYTGTRENYVADGIVTSNAEIVSLLGNNAYGNFISKFTSEGAVIWSNEYAPDYPQHYWWQYPWYEGTRFNGMIMARDSTYYIYGSALEHGSTLNGGEDPPSHWAGLILHIDKYGGIIAGKYIGNWRTDYTINSFIQLSDGNFAVYLRSLFDPYISKVLCINDKADIFWGAALQTYFLYKEVDEVNPVMKQLKNGNVVVANAMVRHLDDTIQYPFTPPIILPAPLYYFHLFEIDGKNGDLLWERSSQCPHLTNTNVNPAFIPRVKSIAELPNGYLSFCGDMYVPADNLIFYAHKLYTRHAVNFITDKDGYFLKLLSYSPQSGSCSLQNVWQTGNNGEQILLAKDSANQKLILFHIDDSGKIISAKSFSNINNTKTSSGFILQKPQGNGYFVFQGDPYLAQFNLNITNSIGNNPCIQLAVTMLSEDIPWPWYVDKVHFLPRHFDVDFRYSPFNFAKKQYPLGQHTDCQYQYVCCTDFIDSLHPHNISICEDQS